jgi:hypothetical protein
MYTQPPQILSFEGRCGLNPKPFETLPSFLRLNPANVETQKNEVLNQNNTIDPYKKYKTSYTF